MMNKAKEQSKPLLGLIKPRISYPYYGVPFSKPNTNKIDEILSKLTKNMCKLPNSTTNVLTHLTTDDYGINTTFFVPNHTCIGKKLTQALHDQGQLGKIYQRLAKYMVTKDEGSLNLPKLSPQACTISPTSMTLYILGKEFGIHVDTTIPSS